MKIAFVFPGQGSQSVGMMSGYDGVAPVLDTFEQAKSLIGEDLWAMAQDGPAETLNQTTNTQPLMLVSGVAVFRAWIAAGGRYPDMFAGHSLGEYSALVATDAMRFEDALPLVRYRAECMQEAVPAGSGAMAAVLGLDDDGVRAACAEASSNGEVAEAANFNAPGQVVVAGQKAAVERAVNAAKERGAKRAMLLPMSAPSHCSLMRPASELLAQRLGEVSLSMPRAPVIHNESVNSASDVGELRQSLVRQLHRPVRWAETVRYLIDTGVTHIVECGPGKVLAGLNRRIGGEVQTIALTDKAALENAVTTLKE